MKKPNVNMAKNSKKKDPAAIEIREDLKRRGIITQIESRK